jgi:hypothetical protein
VFQCVIPHCVSEPPNLKAVSLLQELIYSRESDDLLNALFSTGFHAFLLEKFPSETSCRLLSGLIEESKTVREWVAGADTNLWGKIDECIRTVAEDIGAVLWLLERMIPKWFENDSRLRVVFEDLAALILETEDVKLLNRAVRTYGFWARDWTPAVEILFQDQRFDRLLAAASDPSKTEMFLWVIEECLCNIDDEGTHIEGSAASRILGEDHRQTLLSFLGGPLTSEKDRLVRDACALLSRLIRGPESVEFCIARDYWGLLVSLLEAFDDFSTKTEVCRAICSLVGCSNLAQAELMAANGFFDILDQYIEEMMFEIPAEVLDALTAYERHAENEKRRDWFDLVFTDKIAGLLNELAESGLSYRRDADFTVAEMARGLLLRIEN